MISSEYNAECGKVARDLTKFVLQAEYMDQSAAQALTKIGNTIHFKTHPEERNIFNFYLVDCKRKNTGDHLQLNVLKGSLFTYIWSTFARFDDEYALYYCTRGEKKIIWHMRGVDALNAKIGSADVDWFQMQTVQNVMEISGVNLVVFSRLLGRLLLSLPYFNKTRNYIAPMPASFMYTKHPL